MLLSILLAVASAQEPAPTEAPPADPAAATPSATPAAAQLRAVQAADSSSWDDAVTPLLADAYDADKSGKIDTAAEVAAIDCDTWKALDEGVHRYFSSGLSVVYGFSEGFIWVGYALGFEDAVRVPAAAALAACGLADTPSTQPEEDEADEETGDVDDRITRRLLSGYDADGSGALNKKEALAIPCDVLREADALVREEWGGTGMKIIHGFRKDLIWVGDALGFEKSTRAPMFKRLESCGL